MFVHRSNGVAAAALGVLALGACGDPELNTDLRPAGPPDVLAVLVMADAVSQLSELATFCKPGDELRPSLVGLPDFTTQQVCPETVSEAVEPVETAYPDGWYVRIMFDELLDTNIETLTEITDDEGEGTGTFSGSIRDANPVTLQCRSVTNNEFVNVDYDGYYSPSGNRITWPVGPSLVIKPNDPTLVATGKECQVTINESVLDKEGNPVPEAQRGPYTFKIAPIEVVYLDPPDDSAIDALQIYYENVYVQFNTEPDPATFCDEGPTCATDPSTCTCEFQLSPEIGICTVSGTACDVAMAGADCPSSMEDCAFLGYYAYTYYPSGARSEFGFGPVLPIQTGTAAAPKEYSFFFKEGAQIADRCGAVTTFGAPSVADQTLTHFTVEAFAERSVNLLTGEVASPLKKLTLQMNNVVDFTSLGLDEWTLTPDVTIAPDDNTPCTTNADCDGVVSISTFGFSGGGECRMFGAPINGRRCVSRYDTSLFNDGDFVLRGHYQLDTEYTFTLKAGATINDFYGATWTNPEEIKITWKTQAAISLGSISPSNNATVTKATPTSATTISLPFNQSMDAATLTEGDDFTVTPAVAGLTVDVSTTTASCTESGKSCSLTISGVYAPGTYMFTLKQGATITDALGNVYTHPQNTVITFTVEDASATSAQCL